MPESLEHTGLLHMLVKHVQSTHISGKEVILIHDLPGHIGCEKPPTRGRPNIAVTRGNLLAKRMVVSLLWRWNTPQPRLIL